MPIEEFTDIKVGRDSSVFKRYKLSSEKEMYREQLSFTIYGNKRTLDLEAQAWTEIEQFITMLRVVMAHIKSGISQEQED